MPRSRHNPQFNSDDLRRALRVDGIEYIPLRELGGLRQPRPDSPNTGWRNKSFRGYADYMQTEEFANGLAQLITERRATYGHHVRRSCSVALPSFAGKRRLERTWYSRYRNPA